MRFEFIKTISSQSIFLRKSFERTKSIKAQNNQFPPLRSFYVRKIVIFVVFCSLVFVFLVVFVFICVFVRSKLFRKKKS